MEIFDVTLENLPKFGICGYSKKKTDELSLKSKWISVQQPLGLKIKTLYSEESGTQGMIEYIPGEYCWRPVDAGGYLFIHCIFVGFRKEYKNLGWGSKLLRICVDEAKALNASGTAVVVRKGSFMAKKDFFVKHGFRAVDSCPPDFELLVLKHNDDAPDPRFKDTAGTIPDEYMRGTHIFRSGQCPYTLKNVSEMIETAKKVFHITPEVVELNTYRDAQNNPSPFGTFCIIHDGKIVAHHPISRRRFENILQTGK